MTTALQSSLGGLRLWRGWALLGESRHGWGTRGALGVGVRQLSGGGDARQPPPPGELPQVALSRTSPTRHGWHTPPRRL
jgi:hypothetical protein